jgi:hypothetical protein
MIVTPGSEASARKILSIFNHFNCEPGHVLVLNNLLRRRLSSEDLIKGLEFAKQEGWIETTSGGQYKLTKLGFSEP